MNLRELLIRAMTNPTTDVSNPDTPGTMPQMLSSSPGSSSAMGLRELLPRAIMNPTTDVSAAFTQPEPPPPQLNAGMVPPPQQPQSAPQIPPQMMQRPPMPQQRPRAPAYDEAAMQRVIDQIQNGQVTEGQNANIGDDSRARALAQIAALRG